MFNNCNSIDSRKEFITIFSKHKNNVIYLKNLYQMNINSVERNFSLLYKNYNFQCNHNFTDTQKFVQKLLFK